MLTAIDSPSHRGLWWGSRATAIALCVSQVASAGVGLDSAPAAVSANAGGTLSWNHTVSGANRLLLVMTEIGNGQSVSAVTYAGQNLSFLRADKFGPDTRSDIWFTVAPAQGTNAIQVIGPVGTNIEAGSASFTGVDQVSPFAADAGASFDANPATVTIASAPGQLVVGVCGLHASTNLTSGSGQLPLWSAATGSTIAAATLSGAAPTVTLTWNNATTSWAVSAVSLRPAASIVVDAGPPPDAGSSDAGPVSNPQDGGVDSGTLTGPQPLLSVGCDCQQSGAFVVPLALAVLLWTAARRRDAAMPSRNALSAQPAGATGTRTVVSQANASQNRSSRRRIKW